MKKKLLWLILTWALLFTFACDETLYDNFPPVILVNGSNQLTDTIKRSVNPVLTFEFTVEDDQPFRDLTALNVRNGLLKYQGKIINDAPVEISLVEKGTLEYESLREGATSFTLMVQDDDRKSTTATVDILAFDNLPPVASLILTQTNEVTPYQVKIDASQSYDADQRWGGGITQWEFTITGFYTTVIDRPVIQYIFPEPGRYQVRLRVRDNDQVWSEMTQKEVVVK